MEKKQPCSHIQNVTEIKHSKSHVCEECIKTNSEWVHLRTCQSCGVTLCCDNSVNQHMTAHFHKTKHPVVVSAEMGERWIWCYVDEMFADY